MLNATLQKLKEQCRDDTQMSWLKYLKKLLTSKRESSVESPKTDASYFADVDARELMIQRNEMILLRIKSPKSVILNIISTMCKHYRVIIPAYGNNIDDIKGYIMLSDLVEYALSTETEFDWNRHIHKIPFVAPSMHADELFARMKKTGIRVAVVLDEYGGTDGIVYIDNILDAYLGTSEAITMDDGKCEVSGRIDIDVLMEKLKIDLSVDDMPNDIETLGGLILFILGRVPVAGEVVEHKEAGVVFTIKEASAKSISKVIIERKTNKVH